MEKPDSAASPSETATATALPSVRELLDLERARQQKVINLIASENLPSQAVMEALGHEFVAKYAEGYPGNRYYAGCGVADMLETAVIEKAKALFGAEHANVQPHSGTQANQAAYQALLKPGDTILAMDLAHGGHLSHGAKVNFSAQFYRVYHYQLGADERLDYDLILQKAREVQPRLIVAGSSTYSRIIDWAAFRRIADDVGAYLLCDIAHVAGLIAGKAYPDPVPFADVCTFTTQKTLRGPRSGCILSKAKLARAIDKAVFPGCQGGPNLAVIAAKGIGFEESATPAFQAYAQQVVKNAQAMAEVIGAELPIVSGGTDCHMFTVSLVPFELTGDQAQTCLESHDIIVNKQLVPNDTRPPREASGIRIGTPTITTQGYDEAQSRKLAERLLELLHQSIRKQGACPPAANE